MKKILLPAILLAAALVLGLFAGIPIGRKRAEREEAERFREYALSLADMAERAEKGEENARFGVKQLLAQMQASAFGTGEKSGLRALNGKLDTLIYRLETREEIPTGVYGELRGAMTRWAEHGSAAALEEDLSRILNLFES